MTGIKADHESLRSGGGKLKGFGGKVQQAGETLETTGQNLVSHASNEQSGVGAVVAKAMGKGVEVTGTVFKEGGRVAGEAGGRLGTTADLYEDADTKGAGGLSKLHPDAKAKSLAGGGVRAASDVESGGKGFEDPKKLAGGGVRSGSEVSSGPGGKDHEARNLPPANKNGLAVKRGKGFGPGDRPSSSGSHGSISGDLHDPSASAPKVRYSDEGGIQQRNPDGTAVPSWKLKHPEAGLVDQDQVEKNQHNPDRQGIVDRPGRPASDPEVQKLTSGYEDKKWGPYDSSDPQAEQKWRHDYVTETDPATGKPTDYRWPDKDTQPNGFDSPEERHPAVIEPGSVIDRFGKADGRFLSPPGTPYDQRGLPPQNLDDGYHQYQVLKPIPVWAGKIAPAMGQPGGGIQYLSPTTVADLVMTGHLKEI